VKTARNENGSSHYGDGLRVRSWRRYLSCRASPYGGSRPHFRKGLFNNVIRLTTRRVKIGFNGREVPAEGAAFFSAIPFVDISQRPEVRRSGVI
jgi:hypothetical protein